MGQLKPSSPRPTTRRPGRLRRATTFLPRSVTWSARQRCRWPGQAPTGRRRKCPRSCPEPMRRASRVALPPPKGSVAGRRAHLWLPRDSRDARAARARTRRSPRLGVHYDAGRRQTYRPMTSHRQAGSANGSSWLALSFTSASGRRRRAGCGASRSAPGSAPRTRPARSTSRLSVRSSRARAGSGRPRDPAERVART